MVFPKIGILLIIYNGIPDAVAFTIGLSSADPFFEQAPKIAVTANRIAIPMPFLALLDIVIAILLFKHIELKAFI